MGPGAAHKQAGREDVMRCTPPGLRNPTSWSVSAWVSEIGRLLPGPTKRGIYCGSFQPSPQADSWVAGVGPSSPGGDVRGVADPKARPGPPTAPADSTGGSSHAAECPRPLLQPP